MGNLNFIFAYLYLNFFKGKSLKAFPPQRHKILLQEKKKKSVISECILKCFRQLD